MMRAHSLLNVTAVRIGFFLIAVVVGLVYYRYFHTPSNRAVVESLEMAGKHASELSERDQLMAEYRTVAGRLKQELVRAGIKERERWHIASGQEMVAKLESIFAANDAQLLSCVPRNLAGSEPPIVRVETVFQSSLSNLLRIVREIDRLPHNVAVEKFVLQETDGGRQCRVRLDLKITLDQHNNPSEKQSEILIP